MKINEVIRKYRKEQNLTQEQVANYLGVSAPAVNKWENGISYPDITLLAPLARVLKTDIDTLLSFHEELTEEEINRFVIEISSKMRSDGYKSCFEKAIEQIKEYPNCDKLILNIAQILNAYLTIQDIEDKESYEMQIIRWFETVVTNGDSESVNIAAASLSQIYTKRKDYDRAQKLLDQIPPLGYDKRIMQAMLYVDKKEYEKAFELEEQMLYKSVNEVMSALQFILTLLTNTDQAKKADQVAAIARSVAEQFELGSYVACTPQLCLALKRQDQEESLQLFEEMVDGIEQLGNYENTLLYPHMKFNELNNLDQFKSMLKESLKKDEEVAFLKDNKEFKRIMKKLEVSKNN